MHKFISAFVFLCFLALAMLAACSSARNMPSDSSAAIAAPVSGSASSEFFRDIRDGQVYKMVKIGSQTWMAENLNYELPESFCLANENENCIKYGRLYTWEAAMKACPDGWHLPTKAEWGELFDTVSQHLAIDLALKSSSGWKNEKNGSDLYGFSALPAGTMFIDSYGTRYKSEGFGVYFWSSTRYDKNDAFSMSLHDERDGGNLFGMNKKAGLNVRCVKD